ncbi:hypothetical protein [Haladaptatus sp. AB643]|uniref:hypothetical protein n=1 Tax=Haladaptatus sp. AB643 TaxID=2934174 RepID=UPI00209C1AB0|nr:hypothetical protein [Haladaptatus sp. AB643]MCO8244278.1 hypothetical protein [Haladaptatus sp. AB643]
MPVGRDFRVADDSANRRGRRPEKRDGDDGWTENDCKRFGHAEGEAEGGFGDDDGEDEADDAGAVEGDPRRGAKVRRHTQVVHRLEQIIMWTNGFGYRRTPRTRLSPPRYAIFYIP